MDKISRCVSNNRADLTTEARKVLHQARALDDRRNQHTKAMFRHLFPVQPCVRQQEDDDIVAASEADDDPNLESGCNFEMMETMADAMSTSYIQVQCYILCSTPVPCDKNSCLKVHILPSAGNSFKAKS